MWQYRCQFLSCHSHNHTQCVAVLARLVNYILFGLTVCYIFSCYGSLCLSPERLFTIKQNRRRQEKGNYDTRTERSQQQWLANISGAVDCTDETIYSQQWKKMSTTAGPSSQPQVLRNYVVITEKSNGELIESISCSSRTSLTAAAVKVSTLWRPTITSFLFWRHHVNLSSLICPVD